MFQKESLIKRYTFIIYDVFALVAAMFMAYYIRFGETTFYDDVQKVDGVTSLYSFVLVVSVLTSIFMNMVFEFTKHVFDRGIYAEFVTVVKLELSEVVAVLLYLFASKNSGWYSRIQMLVFFGANFVFLFAGHQILKYLITVYFKGNSATRQIMLISSSDKVESILEHFDRTNNWYFNLAYIVLIDVDRTGENINGIPIIANKDTMLESSKEIALDGVFINVSYGIRSDFNIQKTLHDFQDMGVVVHVNIDALELDVTNKVIENLGFFKVVSYSNRLLDPAQLIIKKCMDKIGGLVGCIITILVGIVVVPAILIESPGSPIYSQIRVGKNGRHFKIYKFRSMYKDADRRKAELMELNEMDGAIFKIADDPRITKVGKFIRKHSIDELPQFFNVLAGDMSLVGTRPPTVDEVEKYTTDQKRRLSVTPGITGLWQTSGRSSILDFDQIVKLDLEYIDRWSIGLDIKLLFKTVWVCISGSGAE